jgi:RND family efflux transporter MFP subunit
MKNPMRMPGYLILLSLTLAACGDKSSHQQGPPPVRVAAYQVQAGQASYFEKFPATVVALNQVEIRPEVSGYITNIFFKDGGHIRKGMKLYEIEQQQYQAAYDQAAANLNAAKANLAKLQKDVQRYEELAQQDAVARQTLDHSKDDLEEARMQVAAAQAGVKTAENNLQHSIIYAPFDCTIGITQVHVGSAVTTGQTLLNTISSDQPMAVDCDLDEKEINRFSSLLHQPGDGNDSTFTIVLPDQSVYSFAGRLALIDRAVDPQTGTIRVRLIFPNPDYLLKPGMNCDLRVRSTTPPNSVLVPYRAVVEQMGEHFIFVIDSKRALERKIALGPRVSDMVVVNDGIRPGEQIVLEGTQKLRDSAFVVIVPPEERASDQPSRGK